MRYRQFVKSLTQNRFTVWKSERLDLAKAIIDFAKKIPVEPVTERIISQLVGAGTSVGANYDQADDAVSKTEFLKCIGTCKKEARESKHFLRMAARAFLELKSEVRGLWLEAKALHLIFAKIWRSGKSQRQSSNGE
jgi:four helix bundle protein